MLVLLIALTVMAVAIPSVNGVLSKPRTQESFEKFDAMVQGARDRSRVEGRNYVIVWGREKAVLMRPEAPANRAEAEGMERWEIATDGELKLHLPAALPARGATPEAIWTFWPDGTCEPAEVRYKGESGTWSAVYNAFTARAEVRYE